MLTHFHWALREDFRTLTDAVAHSSAQRG